MAVIAVVGLAGAGKTTAINFLESFRAGQRVYAGQLVLDEIAARNLPLTPENEKKIRDELRDTHGSDVFAAHSAETVLRNMANGVNSLLDAVLSLSELRYFQNCGCGDVSLFGITTDSSIRYARLRERSDRKLDAEAVRQRDEYEISNLQINSVFKECVVILNNDGTLADLAIASRGLLKDFKISTNH